MFSLPATPRRRWLVGVAAAAALAAALPTQATQPLRQNLTQLIAQSDLIVSGTVISVTDGLQGSTPYTEVTLRVKGALRKQLDTGSTYSFRQWGLLAPRRMADGTFMLPMQIQGMPSWKTGENVVVFLNPAASRTGLRSPVGLNQGKFSTLEGRMTNGANNQGLFEGVSVQAALAPEEAHLLGQYSGPLEESTLMSLVQKAVDGRWIETGVMR